MISIQWTYDVHTHESTEHGESAEHGFWGPGGWQFPIGGCECDNPMPVAEAAPEPCEYESAREAIADILRHVGAPEGVPNIHDGKMSVYPGGCGNENFRTGANTYIQAHVTADPRLLAAMAIELNR